MFGLAFFHAIIQDRKKFGPLGWNVKVGCGFILLLRFSEHILTFFFFCFCCLQYEFNDSDLDVSQQWLRMLLDEQKEIPWDSLLYVLGEINYGGRVTDSWDRRCIMAILRNYFTPQILDDAFAFSESGVYRAPPDTDKDGYLAYINSLPLEDAPEVFGMHINANITNQVRVVCFIRLRVPSFFFFSLISFFVSLSSAPRIRSHV